MIENNGLSSEALRHLQAIYTQGLQSTGSATGTAGSYNPFRPRQGTCPSCGHCPHCGRGGWHQSPYHYYYGGQLGSPVW